jgi:hypothetical protein
MMFPAQVRRFVTVQWSRLLVLRWWPALVYPLALAAGSAALAARDAAGRLEWLSAASTNLQNLQAHPLRSLAESAVLIDADVVAWVALAAFGLTGLVVAAGPLRAAVVAVSAHVVGTLVSEGALGVRVAQGLEPASARSIVDVGPSFVVVGVLAATVVAGRGPVWRLLAAAAFGLLVPSLFEGLTQWDVAAVGHVTALAVGVASGALLFARRPGQAASGLDQMAGLTPQRGRG